MPFVSTGIESRGRVPKRGIQAATFLRLAIALAEVSYVCGILDVSSEPLRLDNRRSEVVCSILTARG